MGAGAPLKKLQSVCWHDSAFNLVPSRTRTRSRRGELPCGCSTPSPSDAKTHRTELGTKYRVTHLVPCYAPGTALRT